MAKQVNPQNTNVSGVKSFDKELVEDIKNLHTAPNTWSQARNATPNSVSGDLGDLGNEPGNLECAAAPYTIIGFIHIEGSRWAVFSTDDTDSEIGLFDESRCTYNTIVNDQCLNFSTHNLISGVSKENPDCSWQVYWSDKRRNPDRTMNIDKVPWVQVCTDENGTVLPGPTGYVAVGCINCVDTDQLDCDAIRLEPLIQNPCFTLNRGSSSGELLNGSYFVVGAYIINGQRITDYSLPSNVQGLFSHQNVAGSLEVTINNMDESFDEFELVIVSITNEQTVARRVGIYSTRQRMISIDIIDNRWPTVGLDLISLRNPIAEASDAIFRNGDYMLRVGPVDKFDFNYQPLANQIVAKWVATEYPADYYRDGGNNTGYMRDEVYSFFIRWVYNTGDKSASYHIPGRASTGFDLAPIGGADAEPEVSAGIIPNRWRVKNTANITAFTGATLYTLPDGGAVVAEGQMGYWESAEYYDDDKPEVWNATNNPIWGTTNVDHDLCGKPIRHHKFPENSVNGNLVANHYNQGGTKIRVMGVKFENIKAPLDNQGNPIPGVVGYEILRGTREGNKSVLAKGMINNMRQYAIQGNITNRIGLYANYPYNDLTVDPYLQQAALGLSVCAPFNPNFPGHDQFSRNIFSFHSPDTSFKDPFLSAKVLKNYVTMYGAVDGHFEFPDKHPKHKIITNVTFAVGLITGIGFGIIKANGTRTTSYQTPTWHNIGFQPTGSYNSLILGGTATGTFLIKAPTSTIGANLMMGTSNLAQTGAQAIITSGGTMLSAFGGISNASYFSTLENYTGGPDSDGTIGEVKTYSSDAGPLKELPVWLSVLQAVPSFMAYMGEGFETAVRLLKAFSQYRQYALQYQSHGFYNNVKNLENTDNTRRSIKEAIYVDPAIQDFGTSYRINNVFRSRFVGLEVGPNPILGPTGDDTRFTISSRQGWPGAPSWTSPQIPYFGSTAYSHYTALVQTLRNQYGQIESIVQVPVSTCPTEIGDGVSPVLFNGDIYINRYTEKNTMYFFYDWLFDQPNGTFMDYSKYQMLPFPRYWANTEDYELSAFMGNLINSITGGGGPPFVLPSNMHALDRASSSCGPSAATGWFVVKNAYFYLFNSGVRDFFVESEINVGYRDWGDNDTERHYDHKKYTDLRAIFNTSIIKATNYYKYDFSLSVAKLYNNYISWGNTQPRYYDPQTAETCYVYRPNRVLYSLPQQLENLRDNWRIFLTNNYRDFKSRVTSVKPVNKNGALFLFENESPIQFLGVDQLQTDAGTKITIGDGGLFNQPLQNLINTDDPFEYGSCQNRLAVINTASGLFWMSQNQGKIFQYTGGVKEISMFDMKWWFAEYLPYKLTEDFPDFELTDNPVAGIGCQIIYDNESQLIYFCKKDYQLRRNLSRTVTYVSADDFLVDDLIPIKLGDPYYFEDASWTVSYDPKTEGWISYHDWHPNLTMPSKTNFLTTDGSTLWKHNYRCDLYCNYYGVNYPFEVEFTTVTPQSVNTVRNVEYLMEAYRYAENCFDRFHVLDFNFDEAVVYNTEQCSGLLRLNLSPKNNAPQIITFPQVNPGNIDILYSKEEQKYRFNQFWDITDDRGEFNPIAERVIWNTEANGYIRNLNPNNLNYDKFQLERKKFRHYKNTVLLRRMVCGNRKMLISLANVKQQYSPR